MTAGMMPSFVSVKPKTAAVGGDDGVGDRAEPGSPGDRRAVDARDDGLRTAVDRAVHVGHRLGVAEVRLLAQLERGAHPVDVRAAAERRALALQHDDAHVGLAGQRLERLAQRGNQLRVQGVAYRRASQDDASARPLAVDTQDRIRHGLGRSPRSPRPPVGKQRAMIFRRLLTVTVAAALVSAPSVPTRAQTPSSPASHVVDVTRATLSNGMQVVVLRDTLAPVVSTWMNYLAGGDEEPITGIAHAQEHMMFRGSKTLSASQFADTTAITGGTFDADTQNEMTQYFFEMPSQYLDVALNLERSRATGILDSQKLWNEERGAITQEVTSDNSNATYRLYAKAVQHVLAGTPYADLTLGTVAVVQAHPGERSESVLRSLVPSEQRDLRHRGRRRSAGDDREGQGALRQHPRSEAPRAAGGAACGRSRR